VKKTPTTDIEEELQTELRKSVIDRRGQLEAELAPILPKIAEAKALDAEIRKWPEQDKIPGERTVTYQGDQYGAVLSMAAEQTKIRSMMAVFLALKRDRFLELCGFTLEKLKSAVTEERFERLTLKLRTGTRSITVIPR
jgi:hypothetical protein